MLPARRLAGPPCSVWAGPIAASWRRHAVRALACLLGLLLTTGTLSAQPTALDVLDGETLYEGGWLASLESQTERRDRLASGWSSVADPLRRRATFEDTRLSLHHGLRHDLQLSLLLPWVRRELRLNPVGGTPRRLAVSGPGDAIALAKWRIRRWDAPHVATNLSLLVGLELPTGEDGARDGGLLLPPDLQPGRGSWNPMLGLAFTHEPGRWRFNAAVLHTEGGGGGRFETGDGLFAELAVGHRFWLEPYPGPFMRADLALRHRRDERVTVTGAGFSGPPLAQSTTAQPNGGEVTSLALNWAFRPRPEVDLQVELERPLAVEVYGRGLADETTLALRLGYRY